MKNRSVILNSGGFDSICLMHHVHHMIGVDKANEELFSLFFDYGQKSVHQERACSKKCAEKLGIKWREIRLPKFNWTKGGFYRDNYENMENHYLEWRNLVFLAYAFSYAESIGAGEIYMAAFRCLNGSWFKDADPVFFSAINSIAPEDIQVLTPFMGGTKGELAALAKYYNIGKSDFNSCDFLVDGKPCGMCADCLAIEGIYKEIENC